MNDLSTLIPTIAEHLHIAPSQLLFYLFVLNIAGRAIARRIPDDATGFWGFVRQSAAIFGVEIASRVTGNTTVADVAKASLATPPIPEKVAEERGA